ncbi:MAG: exodeoxyribonuclease VII small subunit [Bacteriovoracaceae bacterium]|jgi:exodeoxyribonuclease VII small subunit|nr:exodeoxyribonuclease VII small subunit [Bacteriovoracaceae bacterium]
MAGKSSEKLEDQLEKLEEVVELLENGELDLESSLKKFEDGVALYKKCKKSLVKIEKKVKVLTEDLQEQDFE